MKCTFSRILGSRILMLALTSIVVFCQGANFSPDKVLGEFKLQNPDQRLKTLNGLLKEKSEASLYSFYLLLEESGLSDSAMFKEAFAASGNLKAVMGIGSYMNRMLQFFLKEYDQTASDKEKQQALDVRMFGFNRRLNPLAPEIKLVAEKNFDYLIAALKKSSAEKIPAAAGGAIIGLQAMGEEGFERLLASVKNKEDENMVFGLAEIFGPYIVLPVLKAFENPASNEFQKSTAGLLIMSFSKTNSLVIDEVVEALRHGRYFDVSVGKKGKDGKTVIGLEDALKMAENWWGNYLNSHYRGESAVAEYVAKTHLENPNGQEAIIHFVAEIDFQAAKPYLEKIDPKLLSEESLEALFFICSPPLTYGRQDSCLENRCDLFCKLFLKSNPEKRKDKLYIAKDFPANTMANFYINNWQKFSDEEKSIVIFNCGRENSLGKFPEEQRNLVFEKIRPMCSTEQKGMIEYYLK